MVAAVNLFAALMCISSLVWCLQVRLPVHTVHLMMGKSLILWLGNARTGFTVELQECQFLLSNLVQLNISKPKILWDWGPVVGFTMGSQWEV